MQDGSLKTETPYQHLGFREIAERAGVSVSTVDRVLNERGSVSTARRLKVLEAARQLGLRRILPEVWHKTRRVEVILPRNRPGNLTPFWDELHDDARRLAQDLPGNITLHRTRVPEEDREGLVAAILNPPVARDALIIAADATPSVRAALTKVMARGEQVVTIVTDVSDIPRHPFGGPDSRAMGRTAGALMSGFLRGEGEILVLQISDSRQEQTERVEGFQEMIDGRYPLRIVVTDEDVARTRALTIEAFRRSALRGIYLTGHSPEAIADLLRHHPQRPVWIAHERSAAHRALIREGVLDFVLDQDAEAQMAWALGLVARSEAADSPAPPDFRIYCRGNV